MKLENTILNEVSHVQKEKGACSLSYVEYRPHTNTAISRKPGHIQEGEGKRRKLR
jgi:hypothetical protein